LDNANVGNYHKRHPKDGLFLFQVIIMIISTINSPYIFSREINQDTKDTRNKRITKKKDLKELLL